MVYLLCFHSKLKHAKHYLGFCEEGNLEARMKRHRSGQGSKLVKAVMKAGIDFTVVRVWPDADRNFERKLKNKKNSATLCPCCSDLIISEREIPNLTQVETITKVVDVAPA